MGHMAEAEARVTALNLLARPSFLEQVLFGIAMKIQTTKIAYIVRA